MILVDAIYIHESGGKELLVYFIESLQQYTTEYFLLLDERFTVEESFVLPNNSYQYLKGTEQQRRFFYKKHGHQFSGIFCFANVPPPVPQKKTPVFIFMQNTLLLDGLGVQNGQGIFAKMMQATKRWYIRYRNKDGYQWLVQTKSMMGKLNQNLGIADHRISILPFFRELQPLKKTAHPANTFLYVADGVPQKNHDVLLNAWEHLFDRYGVNPELWLTVPAHFNDLIDRIAELNNKGLNIINHGRLKKEALNHLYSGTDYLVFPSLAESFGLPLVESVYFECGVLAADLPYVYEVIEPSLVFEANNMESISASVISVLNKEIIPAHLVIKNHIKEILRKITDQ